MRFLYGVSLLLTAASATDVRLIFIRNKETNTSSLIAYGASGDLITRICGTTIEAKESVDFSKINDNGVGNFTVGSTSFSVNSDPKFSGGPSCSTDFDHPYTAIQCSGVKWDLEGLVKQDAEGCFFTDEGVEDAQYHKLQRRCFVRPVLDGTGWPHQRYYYEQLSEVAYCSETEGCSAGVSETETFTFTASFTFGIDEWISGGLSVAQGWTTGSAYTCNGGPGDSVCVWYKVAHTAYTVKKPKGGQFVRGVIASPNMGNRGGGYQCMTGKSCYIKGSMFWDCNGKRLSKFSHCPPPGHPPAFKIPYETKPKELLGAWGKSYPQQQNSTTKVMEGGKTEKKKEEEKKKKQGLEGDDEREKKKEEQKKKKQGLKGDDKPDT
ncbi:hypothetical protein FGADI_10133 [Fusarium gaditjirri]|uniref:Uncharacterized protein n=1 Tax=Fusarium gaditjirri TaxID=282569 RepID=A0A8H4SY67_9HYPO|nr:hypothetical protein FGADI_10133 [Fusarium gaditjirri]